MENIVEVLRRPNWVDESSYPDHTQWSFCNWAWEFLRRNVEFQQACKAAEHGSDSDRLAVAKRFGLQEFKDFKEHFFTGAVPEWLSVIPGILSRATLKDGKLKERVIPHGQVVMTFDLDEMLKNRPTLDAQVYNAGFYLNDCLREYAELKAKKPRSPRPQKAKLFKYLRVHDATVYAGVSDDSLITDELYPGQSGVANNYSGEAKIKHHRAAAANMVESGYLELPAKDYQKIKKK